MTELFKTDKCSPIVAYLLIIMIYGVNIYIINNNLKKFNRWEINNIFYVFLWYEIKLLLILAIILFGLCQYNQQLLSWLILFIPLILVIVKSSYIFMTIFNISKYTPQDNDNDNDKNNNNNNDNIDNIQINNIEPSTVQPSTVQPTAMLNNSHTNMQNIEMIKSSMNHPILQNFQVNESFQSGDMHDPLIPQAYR